MYSVNQDLLVKQVLFGVDTAAHTVLTPITPGYSTVVGRLYSYDPAKANALLAQAGWKMGSGGVRTKNGKKLALDIILFADSRLDTPTQFVASELNKIGFTASTSVQPFATAQASYNSGVHNLGAFGYYGTDPYLLNIWVELGRHQVGLQLVALRQPEDRRDDRAGEPHRRRDRPQRPLRAGVHDAHEGRRSTCRCGTSTTRSR